MKNNKRRIFQVIQLILFLGMSVFLFLENSMEVEQKIQQR